MNRTTLVALERANDKLFLQMANITEQRLVARCIVELLLEREAAIRALHKIAAWCDGPDVTNEFDDPRSARIARETLATMGVAGPPTG